MPLPGVGDFKLLETLTATTEKCKTKIVLHMVGPWLVTPEDFGNRSSSCAALRSSTDKQKSVRNV